ncbi:acyl-CoA dehydrogenase family protein [Pseudobacteriovorax antillogorgiicola]|uniref:Cyclohex-1-ene-1-carbonyl-CoA dehydrogenase n=1 Tax=Pseudobacteriovorax antillogorgiicola TaxID=1513793 RepID=A0A1Y6C4Y0_9BACT|nr:acyl-CoA dehydrogenase family protein [Pseudobacteriovorax antillogorgiicola]TCS49494.1 butyryl-CoA dehydrogenase [Pseudobacteriovorax antillogorgiicola]SMF45939.1 butyryl-CoA dehydrogenase [Pseudobacteriovorax antillogorgiicola]
MVTPVTLLTDDEKMFVDEVEKFAKSQIGPKVLEMDEAELMDPAIIKQCFEMGLMGIEVPEQYGGSGTSFTLAVLAIEALAKVDPSVSVMVDVQNTLVNNIFLNWGTEDQKQKYLKELCTSKVGCYCLTEPNSGSDAFALKTRAYDEGDHYRIDGKKIFITNAKEAEIFVVFANLDPEKGYKGITAFVVEKDNPGLSLGKKEVKLGIRASSTCEVIFDNVKIPKDAVVGEIGKGYKIAIETLNEGRIGIASQMLGLAGGALAGAMKYAGEREQFGSPLKGFQGIQFQLAQMEVMLETAKLSVYNAARLKDAGKPFIREAAIAKYYVSEIAEKIASQGLEIYGGYGFIKEFPAEKFYRDAKIGKLYEGTSNMQLQTIFKLMEKEYS